MSATVVLQEIVDALEMQLDESSSFLDLDTGRVETVSNEFLGEPDESVGEEPGFPAWQKHEFEVAKRIVSTDRFQQLPTKFDVHEWAIMRDFSNSVALERVREDLLNAIHGAGAFRHFKDTLRRHRIESAWFTFRAQALKQIALDWCEEHHIRWQ
jgi:Uncharacterised protein family (UPF0158)